MNFVYCEGCGARLSPGDRTCPKCGRPAPGILSTETSASDLAAGKTASFPKISSASADINRRTPSSFGGVVPGDVSDPSATSFFPVQGETKHKQSEDKPLRSDEDQYHKHKFPWKRVLISAAVIGCLALGGYVVTANPNGIMDELFTMVNQSASEMFPSRVGTQTTQSEGSSQKEEETSQEPTPEVADAHVVGNDTAYDVLTGYYDTIGDYQDRIGDIVTSFNGGYNNRSLARRQEASADAYALRDEVQQTITELDGLTLSDDTLYSEDLDHLKSLATWMFNRVNVICNAWDVSLSFPDNESMSQHTDEILEPLRSGRGDDLELFEENYSAWAPTNKGTN